MIPIVKICSKKKLTSRDLLSRRNRLKRENTLYLKVVLAKKISMIRQIFALINYIYLLLKRLSDFFDGIAIPLFETLSLMCESLVTLKSHILLHLLRNAFFFMEIFHIVRSIRIMCR